MKNDKLLVDAKAVYNFAKQSGFYPEFSRGMADLKTLKTLLHEESCAVDAVEVVHGRWEAVDHDGSWRVDKCSICHRRMHYVDYDQPYQYCPNCGAKMDGDGDG